MRVRKFVEGIVSTTHIDKQGEQLTLEALEGAVEDQETLQRTIWVTLEHDISIPPLGKTVSSRIERLDSGEYAIIGRMEIYDLESYRTLPKMFSNNYIFNANELESLGEESSKLNELEIIIDPNLFNEDIGSSLQETQIPISQERDINKSLLLTSVITLSAGFIFSRLAGKYVEGFAKGLGFDADKTGKDHGEAALNFLKRATAKSIAEVASHSKSKTLKVIFQDNIFECEVIGVIEIYNNYSIIEKTVIKSISDSNQVLDILSRQIEMFGLLQRSCFLYDPSSARWYPHYIIKQDGDIISSERAKRSLVKAHNELDNEKMRLSIGGRSSFI